MPVFDSLALLNGRWGVLSMMVIAPAFARRRMLTLVTALAVIWGVNTAFLGLHQGMPWLEAGARSLLVAGINLAAGALFAHFVLQKRSLRQLLRRD